MVRKMDKLGRIVIPAEIRNELDVNFDGGLDFKVKINKKTKLKELVITKSQENCVFCGDIKNLTQLNYRFICKNCSNKLKNSSK